MAALLKHLQRIWEGVRLLVPSWLGLLMG
ncbi:unnamed protein product [Linum tenue]|uniref:Uncharacterized protein n=1 Tax=Linum tenue TaxID=586396 RepID=A0AAV0RW35_9ROSI|nr:unnamed protein product [Linum tenue]